MICGENNPMRLADKHVGCRTRWQNFVCLMMDGVGRVSNITVDMCLLCSCGRFNSFPSTTITIEMTMQGHEIVESNVVMILNNVKEDSLDITYKSITD